jgi:hypothetical protein
MIEPGWLRIVLDVSALVAGAIAVVTFWKSARLRELNGFTTFTRSSSSLPAISECGVSLITSRSLSSATFAQP